MAENQSLNTMNNQDMIIQQQNSLIKQQQELLTKLMQPQQETSNYTLGLQRIERQIRALSKSLDCVRQEHFKDRKILLDLQQQVKNIKEEEYIFSQAIPENNALNITMEGDTQTDEQI